MSTKTATQLLEFLIGFAEMDLDRLRPGDWLNLQEEFSQVFRQEPESGLRATVGIAAIPPKPLADFTEKDWREVQAALRAVVECVVDQQEQMDREGAIDQILRWEVRVGLSLVPTPVWAQKRSGLVVSGKANEVLKVVLLLLLGQESSRKLGRCLECGRIFLRVRRQRYCTPTCANRAFMRDWRSTPKGRARSQKHARASYHRRKAEQEMATTCEILQAYPPQEQLEQMQQAFPRKSRRQLLYLIKQAKRSAQPRKKEA